ncbi:alpha-1,6-glucosidase domain-containing protein [Lysobacter sp. TY2-98]|uniref:alpha-1,6-glucosidase domain-containing protein n=1 Tax=Lysobacter sp. TY2-98 TaxID=2290922 RepID=UPI001F086608|nr:alpha-1,6-glucosidase domain-containing protein [Lysobacter sp. TY2-98]
MHIGLTALAVGVFAGTAFAAAPTTADCAREATSTTLSAAADPRLDARAYWLDARTLRWPGMPDDGRYRLVGSHDAALRIDASHHVQGADLALQPRSPTRPLAPEAADAFRFLPAGAQRQLSDVDARTLRANVATQWWLVREDDEGRAVDATYLQSPGLLDAAFDGDAAELGPQVERSGTRFGVWAPTARRVALCLYGRGSANAMPVALKRDEASGAWTARVPGDVRGRSYLFLTDVFVPGLGVVRNRVTDPYSVTLTPDSKRSVVEDLGDTSNPHLAPAHWPDHARPAPAENPVDMTVYELHVRDFSVADASVQTPHRGKYLAFTDVTSAGMKHLAALRAAGLTDVHLLPVFDIATIPERGCASPVILKGAPDSPAPQAAIAKVAHRDCYNWGYDPQHFGAPEGSYATDAADGAVRIREFRAMVQALHALALRVGMDVVYNHTTTSGQADTSVLDRIVPGYYYRLDANGKVEHSTCCENTATEHRMMARLMADTLVRWARDYGIDSFRFDLMGHQPRAAMERAQRALRDAVGHDVPMLGEGWNFGEVANGARFVQAAQGRLDGTDIATFSDRARDALRGGGCCDSGEALRANKGWLNGLAVVPASRTDALHAADLIRAGLAGTLRDYTTTFADGRTAPLAALDYAGQAAGYATAPDEVVNYVENHDNLTLFDVNALRLPAGTPRDERARAQVLGIAVVALSQGVAYYHAGIDVLRSKSLDRNSFESGDAFNRLDWTYTDNGFGVGLPRSADNGKDWPLLAPFLRDASIKPAPREIAWTRDVFRDWLKLRATTPLLRLRNASDVERRLSFLNTGPTQNPAVIVGHLDGTGLPGARELLYLVNTSPEAQTLALPGEAHKAYVLHPVQRAGTDARVREARYDPTGRVTVPGRTAAVFVIE